MQIEFEKEQVTLRDMESVVCAMIEMIPVVADEESSAEASRRFYSDPGMKEDSGFSEDWREYVQPDLKKCFLSARELVRQDLGEMKKREVEPGRILFTLSIPFGNLDGWMSALNQARICIAERYRFDDLEELRSQPFDEIDSPETLARFQLDVYDFLLDHLIRISETGA